MNEKNQTVGFYADWEKHAENLKLHLLPPDAVTALRLMFCAGVISGIQAVSNAQAQSLTEFAKTATAQLDMLKPAAAAPVDTAGDVPVSVQ